MRTKVLMGIALVISAVAIVLAIWLAVNNRQLSEQRDAQTRVVNREKERADAAQKKYREDVGSLRPEDLRNFRASQRKLEEAIQDAKRAKAKAEKAEADALNDVKWANARADRAEADAKKAQDGTKAAEARAREAESMAKKAMDKAARAEADTEKVRAALEAEGASNRELRLVETDLVRVEAKSARMKDGVVMFESGNWLRVRNLGDKPIVFRTFNVAKNKPGASPDGLGFLVEPGKTWEIRYITGSGWGLPFGPTSPKETFILQVRQGSLDDGKKFDDPVKKR